MFLLVRNKKSTSELRNISFNGTSISLIKKIDHKRILKNKIYQDKKKKNVSLLKYVRH